MILDIEVSDSYNKFFVNKLMVFMRQSLYSNTANIKDLQSQDLT